MFMGTYDYPPATHIDLSKHLGWKRRYPLCLTSGHAGATGFGEKLQHTIYMAGETPKVRDLEYRRSLSAGRYAPMSASEKVLAKTMWSPSVLDWKT